MLAAYRIDAMKVIKASCQNISFIYMISFSTFQTQRGYDSGRPGRAVADRGGGGGRRPIPHRHPRPPPVLLLRKRQNG